MTRQADPPSPDAHTPTIALLTCRHHDHIDHASEGRLMQELVRQGAAVSLIAWTDLVKVAARDNGEEVRFNEPPLTWHDIFVLRTTWDYWDRLDEFREFLKACATEDDTRFLNPAKTALANLDKTYLQQLQSAGVPIVPTIFVGKGEEAAAIDRAKGNNWAPLIIKPTIAAAAVGLKKFDKPDNAAADYLTELTSKGGALVQPYLPRVTTEGETSLVYFDGVFSHAVTKVPAPGDFRSQVDFGGAYTAVRPTEAQTHVAELALLAWEQAFGDKPLYARVDLVPGHDGQPLLGELELIEPELFLDMDDGAAEMFASAILARTTPQPAPAEGIATNLIGLGCALVLIFCAASFAVGLSTIIRWIIAAASGNP